MKTFPYETTTSKPQRDLPVSVTTVQAPQLLLKVGKNIQGSSQVEVLKAFSLPERKFPHFLKVSLIRDFNQGEGKGSAAGSGTGKGK